MNFSEKIRLLRLKFSMSQEEMAGKLGVSRQTISKWESGGAYPEIDKLIIISDLFDVSIDFLLKDKYSTGSQKGNLERTVLQFLASTNDMEEITQTLIEISSDGIIDEDERADADRIICTLDNIAENIQKIKSVLSSEN